MVETPFDDLKTREAIHQSRLVGVVVRYDLEAKKAPYLSRVVLLTRVGTYETVKHYKITSSLYKLAVNSSKERMMTYLKPGMMKQIEEFLDGKTVLKVTKDDDILLQRARTVRTTRTHHAHVQKQQAESLLQIAINKGVDFGRFGWVERFAPIAGLQVQKVKRWMKKHAPEFYEEFCYKRKASEKSTI